MKQNVGNTHAGPPLMMVAIVYIALFIASQFASSLLGHGPGYVNPYAPADDVMRFFAANATALRVSNFFIFGSAVPLAVFAATVISRVRFHGVRVAGIDIALFGGIAAAAALGVCGLVAWVLSVQEVSASIAAVRALHFLSFLFGGLAFAVGFGVFAAGVSITGYFARLLPRWVMVLGMVIAVAGEFSSLSLITYPANFLLPIARFGGMIWLLAVAAKLPKTRVANASPTLADVA
jgi:hypothetical protein